MNAVLSEKARALRAQVATHVTVNEDLLLTTKERDSLQARPTLLCVYFRWVRRYQIVRTSTSNEKLKLSLKSLHTFRGGQGFQLIVVLQ